MTKQKLSDIRLEQGGASGGWELSKSAMARKYNLRLGVV